MKKAKKRKTKTNASRKRSSGLIPQMKDPDDLIKRCLLVAMQQFSLVDIICQGLMFKCYVVNVSSEGAPRVELRASGAPWQLSLMK